jgi:uncharacterized membrane protein (DUF4010 family)
MSPDPRPGRRSGVAALLPLVVAICVVVLVREVVESLAPGVSTWVVFVAALVAGWLAYAGAERVLDRRDRDRDR